MTRPSGKPRHADWVAFVQRMHDETNCICRMNLKFALDVWCVKCEAARLLNGGKSND